VHAVRLVLLLLLLNLKNDIFGKIYKVPACATLGKLSSTITAAWSDFKCCDDGAVFAYLNNNFVSVVYYNEYHDKS
jgi:hypothetical protein